MNQEIRNFLQRDWKHMPEGQTSRAYLHSDLTLPEQ